MDVLVFTLLRRVAPYYKQRMERRHYGFEGPTLEEKLRKEIREGAEDVWYRAVEVSPT